MSAPMWAYKLALERANARGHTNVPCAAIDELAAMIAAHEEPPVDPVEALCGEIFGSGQHWSAKTIAARIKGYGYELTKTGGDV